MVVDKLVSKVTAVAHLYFELRIHKIYHFGDGHCISKIHYYF